MAARRRGRGGGGDSSLHSVGVDSSLRAQEQQSSSSTRMEPPSVRQQQPRQQGQHGGLLRNATIKEFLEENYPREDWPAVVEVSAMIDVGPNKVKEHTSRGGGATVYIQRTRRQASATEAPVPVFRCTRS